MPFHLRWLIQKARSTAHGSLERRIANLLGGSFFFAYRSCEYCKTPKPGKTKIIRLGGIHLYDQFKREIQHTDPNKRVLAKYVTLTYDDQKNGHKAETRTQEATDDPELSPTHLWCDVIDDLLRVPGANDATPVCCWYDQQNDKLFDITQDTLLKTLRWSADAIGFEKLGYKPEEIGTHSIRSGAAMALFLADQNPYRIMILGRWSSDAFLVYIRPQIMEWTSGMSIAMVSNDTFYDAGSRLTSSRISPEDPCIAHDPNASRNIISPTIFHGGRSSIIMQRLHLF